VVGKKYIDQMFRPSSKVDVQLLTNVIKEFWLNTKQERACHIIVNHGVISNPKMLNMYLGRVGGTGKS
jgi:hypothetical protein